MSLFGWKIGGQPATTSPATTTPKSPLPAPPPPPAPPQPDDPALATARWNHKRFGMENFGNTCYANSVLQALYFCDPFRQLLCDAPDRSYPTGPGAYTTAPPAQPPAPATAAAKSKPVHARRSSTADQRDLSTPHHMAFAGTGAAALAAATFVSPPSVTPHKTTSTPTPAPIVNVGPIIPSFPPSLFSALRSLYIHIAANPADKGTVSPRAFVEKLKKENELFRGNMHQDAHEFLNYLLNSVVEDLTHEMKAGPPEDLSKSIASEVSAASQPASSHSSPHLTLVHDLFEGTLTSETRCLTCETVSSRDESFLDLSIDIERNSSVTACLRQFSASEMLCQKNKFFCDSCCGLQEAEKRMKIKKLPNVLALHLKRFKYQEDVQRYIKLSYRVAFPFELRLFNTVDDAQDPDRLYELFAIVVHVGSGPHHGHYITIAKQRGQWLLFDDDIVEGIRESEIPKYFGDSPAGSGYVLFYQAVNIDLQALGVKSPPSPQTSTVIQPQSIPPVVIEAPTSPGGVVEEREKEKEKIVARTSPPGSDSGTIATPSTPTRSHPPGSPVLSKIEAPSTTSSGFKHQNLAKTPINGSISGLSDPTSSLSSGQPNGETGLTPTKNGKQKESGGGWFKGWGKRKSKDVSSTPSRKNTLDDPHVPFLDIRQPSATTTLRSTSGSHAEYHPPVLHDEPEQSLAPSGLGVEFGTSSQMTDEPVSASVSASSSGEHLHHSGALPQSVEHHLHPAHGTTYKPVAHASPPRASRSGSVSATTNGSGSGSTSGLHVPSYPSPSASSSASSVSTPLRHNASAPKLNAPFPLAMSPMKTPKRPSTASSSPAVPFARTESPPPPLPPLPVRGQPMGLPDLPQPPLPLQPAPKAKAPRRKLSISSALNTFSRSKDKSFSKHDRRISIAEDVEALPQLVPNSPLKRK